MSVVASSEYVVHKANSFGICLVILRVPRHWSMAVLARAVAGRSYLDRILHPLVLRRRSTPRG